MNASPYPVIRPYYLIRNFKERVEGYSSLISRQVRGGLERVTIEFRDEALKVIAHEEHHRPGSVLKALTYLYPLLPLPDPRDIIHTSIKFLRSERPDRARAEFVIRRGHYILGEAARERKVVVLRDGQLFDASGEQITFLLPPSIPSYSIESEEQERYVPRVL